MPSRSITALLALVAMLGAGLALSAAARQPANPNTPMFPVRPNNPSAPTSPPQNVSDVNSVFLPPGEYSAIVLCTNARDRRWIVALKTTAGSFPITIGPNQTVTIPFEKGWSVRSEMQARLESRLVPFEDLSERNLLDGNENIGISAWGITDKGPVPFALPVKRK